MAGAEKILIVDDDSYVRGSLVKILQSAGYQTLEAADAQSATALIDTEFIGLGVIDIKIPGMSGLDLMAYLHGRHADVDTILVTAYSDIDTATTAIKMGAYDIIQKPFHAYSVLMSVRRAMEKRSLVLANQDFQGDLERKIKEQMISMRLRNQEKHQLINNTINSLVQTLEAKDKYTEGHSRRVAEMAIAIAKRMGYDHREREEIHLAGLFHDIGKIGIRETVLHKMGKLTSEEYETIKTHVIIGVKILDQIPQFKKITKIIRHHHEFYNGTGYPDQLAGENIPLGGRILAISDAYDAMTTDRPYRKALSIDQACAIILRAQERQFDPKLVNVILRIVGFEAA